MLKKMSWRVLTALLPCITAADLTTLSELLKEVYDPVIAEQQNLEANTWKEFESGDDKLGGDGWFFETKMGGNQEGIGARGERDTLPAPGVQRWKQGKIYWKLLYGSYELTGPVIEAAKSNLHAFANARTEEIQGLTRDLIKDYNRQVYGDGSGVLATLTASGHDVGANQLKVINAQYLRLNMVVDLWDGNTATAVNRSITAIAPQADGSANITYDGADITPVASSVLIRGSSAKLVSNVRTGLEMDGIKKIVDDGTNAAVYLDITRANFPLWKGHLFDNGGTLRNLTSDLLQQAEDQVTRAAGKRPNWVRMNLGQRRKYFDLVAPDRRYMTGSFDAGYERLDYNGNQLTVDVDHPFGEITMLVKESIRKYELRPFGMLDFDGMTIRMVGNSDVYRGFVGMYANLACKTPNMNVRLADLQEPPAEQWVW